RDEPRDLFFEGRRMHRQGACPQRIHGVVREDRHMALRWPPWLYADLRLLVAPMIKRGNTTPGVGTVGHRAAVRMRQIPYDASPSRAIRPRIRSADRQTTRTSRRRFRAATDLGRRLGRRRLGDRGRSPGARALAEP